MAGADEVLRWVNWIELLRFGTPGEPAPNRRIREDLANQEPPDREGRAENGRVAVSLIKVANLSWISQALASSSEASCRRSASGGGSSSLRVYWRRSWALNGYETALSIGEPESSSPPVT